VWSVAVVQGGSWLLGFAVEGTALLSLSDGGRYHRRAVWLFCHWGRLQLVAVVVAVSRGDDDGCWSLSSLSLSPSFWMVVVVAVIHGGDGGAVMEEVVTEKGLQLIKRV